MTLRMRTTTSLLLLATGVRLWLFPTARFWNDVTKTLESPKKLRKDFSLAVDSAVKNTSSWPQREGFHGEKKKKKKSPDMFHLPEPDLSKSLPNPYFPKQRRPANPTRLHHLPWEPYWLVELGLVCTRWKVGGYLAGC